MESISIRSPLIPFVIDCLEREISREERDQNSSRMSEASTLIALVTMKGVQLDNFVFKFIPYFIEVSVCMMKLRLKAESSNAPKPPYLDIEALLLSVTTFNVSADTFIFTPLGTLLSLLHGLRSQQRDHSARLKNILRSVLPFFSASIRYIREHPHFTPPEGFPEMNLSEFIEFMQLNADNAITANSQTVIAAPPAITVASTTMGASPFCSSSSESRRESTPPSSPESRSRKRQRT